MTPIICMYVYIILNSDIQKQISLQTIIDDHKRFEIIMNENGIEQTVLKSQALQNI